MGYHPIQEENYYLAASWCKVPKCGSLGLCPILNLLCIPFGARKVILSYKRHVTKSRNHRGGLIHMYN